jgi:hypothetical protein
VITRYETLFSVELLHEYYSGAKCRDLLLVPSERTAALLRKYRLRCRMMDDQLVVLTEVDENGRPVPGLASDVSLVFLLELGRPELSVITNLDPQRLRSERVYFSNLADNEVASTTGHVLNLSAPAPVFDPGTTYRPGDIVGDGSGNLFESIQVGQGHAPAASPNFWLARARTQSATSSDLLRFAGSVVNLTLTVPAAAFDIEIFGLNRATGAHDQSLLHELRVLAGGTSRDVQVDLSSFAPGRYRIRVNGADVWIYSDEQLPRSRAIGVVEVFTHLAALAPYALIDSQGKARGLRYTIRFAARRAFWKYFTPRQQVDALLLHGTTNSAPFTAHSLDPAAPKRKDFFQSDRPLSLSESPTENVFDLKLVSPGTGDPPPASKPDPGVPGLLTQDYDTALDTYTNYYCNIHLNY